MAKTNNKFHHQGIHKWMEVRNRQSTPQLGPQGQQEEDMRGIW
jgi:hypothetical protein